MKTIQEFCSANYFSHFFGYLSRRGSRNRCLFKCRNKLYSFNNSMNIIKSFTFQQTSFEHFIGGKFGQKSSCRKWYFPFADDLATSRAFDGIGILAPSPNITFLLKYMQPYSHHKNMSSKSFSVGHFHVFDCICISLFACSLISWALVFPEGFCTNLETSGRH